MERTTACVRGRTDTVDSKPFDRAQGTDTPAEVDLVESFAQGRVNRRDFLRRGSALGLSIPFMGAVLAACGGDDDDDTSTTEGATEGTAGATGTTAAAGGGAAGGTIRVASQKPAGPLDPVAMQDLGTYGIIAQCFEFLCTLGETATSRPGWRSRGSRTRTAASGRSTSARASRGRTAPRSPPPTSRPHGPARRVAANSGLRGYHRGGCRRATDPATLPSSRS